MARSTSVRRGEPSAALAELANPKNASASRLRSHGAHRMAKNLAGCPRAVETPRPAYPAAGTSVYPAPASVPNEPASQRCGEFFQAQRRMLGVTGGSFGPPVPPSRSHWRARAPRQWHPMDTALSGGAAGGFSGGRSLCLRLEGTQSRHVRSEGPFFPAADVVHPVDEAGCKSLGVIKHVSQRRHQHEPLVFLDRGGPPGRHVPARSKANVVDQERRTVSFCR